MCVCVCVCVYYIHVPSSEYGQTHTQSGHYFFGYCSHQVHFARIVHTPHAESSLRAQGAGKARGGGWVWEWGKA